MKEKNRLLLDVEVVNRALNSQLQGQDAHVQGQQLYKKFSETRQEPVKLAVALRGFFMETGVSSSEKETYGSYLKGRIRPAMEVLIEEENVEKMAMLEERGWFGQPQIEGFIKMAKERQKTSSLVWLLHLKNDKYGYSDYDFSL